MRWKIWHLGRGGGVTDIWRNEIAHKGGRRGRLSEKNWWGWALRMRLNEAHAGAEILNILGEQGGGDNTCLHEFVLGGCSDLIFPDGGWSIITEGGVYSPKIGCGSSIYHDSGWSIQIYPHRKLEGYVTTHRILEAVLPRWWGGLSWKRLIFG